MAPVDDTCDMRNKAYRRHQHRRIKARVRREWPDSRHWTYFRVQLVRNVETVVGVLATTSTLCSCAICGNPRHFHGGPSISDRRRAPVDVEEGPWNALDEDDENLIDHVFSD